MIKRSIFTIMLASAAMVVQAQEWFKTDSVTIQGRIEGYDAEQFGFTSMSDTFDDVFEKEGTVLVLDINDDGTFKMSGDGPVAGGYPPIWEMGNTCNYLIIWV